MSRNIINNQKLLEQLSKKTILSNTIKQELYNQFDVKKGLRDIDGVGVLAGLTQIGDVIGHDFIRGEIVSVPGRLNYRGYNIEDLVDNFIEEHRFGFEETTYLLLFGNLPNKSELADFENLLDSYRKLPNAFVMENIMNSPSRDMMNALARVVLTLYSFDEKADDLSIENVLRQSIQLIACLPMVSVYGYQAFLRYHMHDSMTIHNPISGLSTAENFLHMLRRDSSYTPLEAKLLDLALVLHAEHGGGNNSSFITHVATSSATDTYSVIAAALGSLKGLRHGGANNKVIQMFEDLKNTISDWNSTEEISAYLSALLNKEAFDRTGFIYGFGHAVYSISDPRALILKSYASQLAEEKGYIDEFNLYATVEELAPKIIRESRPIYKGVCVNVDFYSGLVYKMLDIPMELLTPVFAMSRIVGWSAHRIEELVNDGKIIRPAYQSVAPHKDYVKMQERSPKV